MLITHELEEYVKENVLPEYNKNEPGHNINHINYVIKRSFEFANTIPGINYDMVYIIAVYHDIGHHIDREKHEIISAKIMQKDDNLKRFFSEKELRIIKEAIEDHRASSNHTPRSIYGKIISTADRNNTVEACLYRSYNCGKKLHPEYSEDEIFEHAYEYLNSKFGENGYAKFFFKDNEYEKFLKEIRKLLSDKENFIKMQKTYINALTKKSNALKKL